MRRDIEFRSEGTICRGWLYMPDGAPGKQRFPTIVMAHGFSAVKEMRLDHFAEAFAAAGLASLVFDYRGLGASDGEPRQDLDPWAQVTDYRNAISCARQLPEVDGEHIGIWGSSYSGGHVLVVGALDRRVKAVVSQVPLIDAWEGLGSMLGAEARTAMVQQLIAERERLYAGGAPLTLPVVGAAGAAAALPGDEAWEWFQLAAKTAPTWKNEITLRSMERLVEYAPGRYIDRIAPTALLMIVAEKDFLPLDITRRAFARAGEPKRLCVLSTGHFAPYEPPHFATASGEAVGWFRQHLLGGA
ncbi:MAG TPA: alpha/beta hydrolase [Candidatus Margulisiibacteriota bacterium]|nr:alpha/beta hydrolase [Candidatus Margulisiibacteriota bacterium]